MSCYFDITNPDASYDWLHSVLDIKKGDFISDYILECNNDFDNFFEKHLNEIGHMDINQLELIVIHVTTNCDECAAITKNGLRDLKEVLQEKTELNAFLNDRGIRFDISSKTMYVNGKTYDINYEKYQDLDRITQKKEALYKIGHKIYFDFQVNGFFFCQDIYKYGNIHRAPEFLLTLSSFNKETTRIDDEWEELSQPYVIKFKARITDFEYFTFYSSVEDYLQDYKENWIKLKRWLLQSAVRSAFSDSASQIFAYMKQGRIIKPNKIVECVPAEQWRNDVFTSNEKIYESMATVLASGVQVVREYIIENAEKIVENYYDENSISGLKLEGLKKACQCEKIGVIKNLVINHITPREDIRSVWKDGIYTLPHTLINKTVLSEYLSDLGFAFEFIDEHISMKRNGEVIDVKRLNFSNLLMRLGGKGTLNDFNVNGYLFVNKYRIDFCRGWLGSPEILKSLSNSFADKSIANNYADKCRNYLVSFKVPIEKIDIESFDSDIEDEIKSELLVKYCINALAFAEAGKSAAFDMYNPIIFLKRDYDVPPEDIEKIYSLENYKGILMPKELVLD